MLHVESSDNHKVIPWVYNEDFWFWIVFLLVLGVLSYCFHPPKFKNHDIFKCHGIIEMPSFPILDSRIALSNVIGWMLGLLWLRGVFLYGMFLVFNVVGADLRKFPGLDNNNRLLKDIEFGNYDYIVVAVSFSFLLSICFGLTGRFVFKMIWGSWWQYRPKKLRAYVVRSRRLDWFKIPRI